MKLFLSRIFLFISILVVSAYILDFCITKGLQQIGGVWKDIFNSNIEADVVINGSSRAMVHYDPEILDSVLHVSSYNFGDNNFGFNTQILKYKLFEKYNHKPRLIIQNVDFITLGQLKNDCKDQLLHYLKEPLLKQDLKKMDVSDFEIYFPAIRYHGEWKKIALGIMIYCQIRHYSGNQQKGYSGMNKEWDGSEFERRELSGDSIVALCDPEIVQLFDSYFKHCKDNDIQVIMVFAPLYFKSRDFTKGKERVLDIYRSFSEEYNIPFLDYSYNPICYDTTWFYNTAHLNKKGAELFSLKLANDIESQGLYKQSILTD